jgi:general stress protein 26
MTVFLGLPGKAQGRPMTAQMISDDSRGPLFFFTSSDTELVQKLQDGDSAEMVFAAKGHDVFATMHGSLALERDRAVIDALWSPFVEAWFEGGKDDPKLRLLRLDGETAEVWLNASSLIEGVKMALGFGDPKESYKDKVATIRVG